MGFIIIKLVPVRNGRFSYQHLHDIIHADVRRFLFLKIPKPIILMGTAQFKQKIEPGVMKLLHLPNSYYLH